MQANNIELDNATRDIAGIWHNPQTKDSYHFGIEKDHKGFAEVLVLQFSLKSPLQFKYRIIGNHEGLWLEIDKNRMQILQLTLHPRPALTFKSANNNIVSLFKDYGVTDE